jgi:glyoxylase-like metal-dependent hydrolase (beta-lactamase superfamily II)
MKNRMRGSVLPFALLCVVAGCEKHPPTDDTRTAPSPEAQKPSATNPEITPAPGDSTLKAHPLAVKVVTGSEDGFLVNSTLVSGDRDAVLIDAQFTLPDAERVAEAVKASGKNLTTVYVTHAHPDHYFGFPAIKASFPGARLVALPATITEIEKTWEAKVKQWQPTYKDKITSKPAIPEPLATNSLELEGQKLEIVGDAQGDEAANSYVWIPSLRTVVTGDIVYDRVYPWTAETTPADRKSWAATLDKLSALHADKVVPGHQKSDGTQSPSSITFTKDYLSAYDEALAASKNATELETKLKAKYPDTALPVIAKIGAEASFKGAPAKAGEGSKTGPSEQKSPSVEPVRQTPPPAE